MLKPKGYYCGVGTIRACRNNCRASLQRAVGEQNRSIASLATARAPCCEGPPMPCHISGHRRPVFAQLGQQWFQAL